MTLMFDLEQINVRRLQTDFRGFPPCSHVPSPANPFPAYVRYPKPESCSPAFPTGIMPAHALPSDGGMYLGTEAPSIVCCPPIPLFPDTYIITSRFLNISCLSASLAGIACCVKEEMEVMGDGGGGWDSLAFRSFARGISSSESQPSLPVVSLPLSHPLSPSSILILCSFPFFSDFRLFSFFKPMSASLSSSSSFPLLPPRRFRLLEVGEVDGLSADEERKGVPCVPIRVPDSIWRRRRV